MQHGNTDADKTIAMPGKIVIKMETENALPFVYFIRGRYSNAWQYLFRAPKKSRKKYEEKKRYTRINKFVILY